MKVRMGLIPAMAAVIASMCIVGLCYAGQDRPSSALVERDFKNLYSGCACNDCVRVSRISMIGANVMGTTAIVELEVVGDWIGLKGCRYSEPCYGFRSTGGMGQVIHKHMRYTKLDSSWRFQGMN